MKKLAVTLAILFILIAGTYFAAFNLNHFRRFPVPRVVQQDFANEESFVAAQKATRNPALLGERGMVTDGYFIPLPPGWYAYSAVTRIYVTPEIGDTNYIALTSAPSPYPPDSWDYPVVSIDAIMKERKGPKPREIIRLGEYEWVATRSFKETEECTTLRRPHPKGGIASAVICVAKGALQKKEDLFRIFGRIQTF